MKRRKYTYGDGKQDVGFTLVEVMVAFSLFTIIAIISLSSLVAMINANQKAQALKSVLNNLNFALESMERNIRVGKRYHCELDPNSVPPPATLAGVKDCVLGGKLLALESSRGSLADDSDQLVYRHNNINKSIEISKDSGVTWLPLTSGGVTVDDLNFIVEGTAAGDDTQPFVIITMKITAGISAKASTTLNIQTSASQRAPDS